MSRILLAVFYELPRISISLPSAYQRISSFLGMFEDSFYHG
jgi:hypothetical protein